MIDIIVLTLLVYLLHLMLPSLIGVVNGTIDTRFLLGSREDAPEGTATMQRVKRAAANLGESLPAFLVLAILSIMNDASNAELATIWLGLRVAYLLVYAMGISTVRTLIWMASIVCLIMMALPLI